jgi:nucleoside-diphosphate-sugar epimerase
LRILITGDEGFVGTETKKLLAYREHEWIEPPEVIGFDAMSGEDIRDFQKLRSVVSDFRPDRILHLAAIARFADADADPLLAMETNVLGTKNISQIASEFRIPIVYSSTGSVYMPIKRTPPITEDFEAVGNSVYGCTKYMGELHVRESKAPWIILRYAHLYGREKRGHGLIGGFLDRINRGLAPTLYGGKQSNDFTYIKDVAQANVLALTASWDKWRQVYNIGTGEELSADQAGYMVCATFGYNGEIEKKEGRTVDAQRFVYDCSKAERMLKFRAKYSFQQGLEDMRDESGSELHDLSSRKVGIA